MRRLFIILPLLLLCLGACRPGITATPAVAGLPEAATVTPISTVANKTLRAEKTGNPDTSPTSTPTAFETLPPLVPSPTTTNAKPNRTTLLFTGVIVPARCVQAAIDERGDSNYIYAEVKDIIQEADLAVGTLNATMSDIPPHTGCVPTYVLVGSPSNADAAREAGFDVMSVATNHIKNCGLANCGDQAFFDTLDNLRRVGIQPVGAGANHAEAMQPTVVEVNGVRFGIVSLGQIEPMAFAGEDTPGIAVLNPENLKEAIEAARQVSDVVIAMPHWGPEDVPVPNWIQRQLAQQLVEAGADLVMGNHTHVVQAMQEIDGVPVFYGLGNFVFDQGLRDHKQGAILKVYFDGKQYAGYEFIPTHVDQDGTVHIAGPEEAGEVLQRIDSASRELGHVSTPAYLPSITLAEAQGMETEAVFQQLFQDWLEHYRSPAWSSRERITAYEMGEIEQEESWQVNADEPGLEAIARIPFSVRPPAVDYSDWASGNGAISTDGWVRDKSLFVGLRQDGGRYWLVTLGDEL